ncbi:MAG: beta-N-acetylhexosaminidase [Bacteroidales bacterium]|nr:beta-N-acetylhexosaminidase [Bacteroidales bacterium]
MKKVKRNKFINIWFTEVKGNNISLILLCLSISVFLISSIKCYAIELSSLGIHVIPYPQQVTLEGEDFTFNNQLTIVLDQDFSAIDQFTADELIKDLKREWNIDAKITDIRGDNSIILTRHNAPEMLGGQGYQITTGKDELVIKANGEDGLFYGTQTLLQIIQKARDGYKVPGLGILDWPDIQKRAVHYDTKHHQDKKSYVKSFIKDLARYKINILVWEWEDKFAYPSHPEIGAPGAFTLKEMQELTRYAQQYHIQIVPLVQGLGHVSFILKWPQHKHLREIEASNWEFCPLNEGSYDLLFDLWDDAIEATPGSEYIHIGSDETYELGTCERCKVKAEEIGKSGLYFLFINRAAEHLQALGRKVMCWASPMGWEESKSPAKGIKPIKGLVFTESYNYNTPDFNYVKEAKTLGYETFAYDPNPGIEQLFLPFFYRIRNNKKVIGSLENSYNLLTSAAISGVFDGMINTSWDDAGLHNQLWMLSFVTSAGYSWNGSKPDLAEFTGSFFKNYYGNSAVNMEELFYLLNEGSYYYAETFERKVWHHGDVGKTHLPDLPRGDALEYDPFWNREYKEMIDRSRDELVKMGRVLQIIENNKKSGVKNSYDFELFRTVTEVIRHTCLTYLDLSNLEYAITEAHRKTFTNHKEAYNSLAKAQNIIENSLKRRQEVFNDLVTTWEETRFPKGMSTKNKEYFWQQDRARHFANRRPDMSYHIYDEQLLDMEGYLEKLKEYMEYYKDAYLD